MMFIFPPRMFAGFLSTAGLFQKPLLEIQVFGTAIGNGSELFEGLETTYKQLVYSWKKIFERVYFLRRFASRPSKVHG